MNKLILTLFFGLFSVITIGQTISFDSLRFAYCEYDSIYRITVFPENVLTDGSDIVITGFNEEIEEKKSLMEISWFSSYIDGTYCFTITPRQMHLRSHHNNPNPNYLYWLEKIDDLKFKLIKEHFDNSKEFENLNVKSRPGYIYSFKNYFTEEYVNNDWEDNMYKNLKVLIAEINKAMKQTESKICIPSERLIKQNSVRLLIDKEEYGSQINLINLEKVSDSLIIFEE